MWLCAVISERTQDVLHKILTERLMPSIALLPPNDYKLYLTRSSDNAIINTSTNRKTQVPTKKKYQYFLT